ncbi:MULTISPECIES: response regulator [unclassified Acinetobacter]|uniref:response regulator n=1 Tax=unclassified Acinetobacter TaxID=196816 RepID=UPI0035B87A74
MQHAPTVLVIEDEIAIADVICMALEQAGFRTLIAENADHALFIIQGKLPDVLLVDWMLPRQSGLSLIQQLRQQQRTAKLPIIMLTAKGTDYDRSEGLDNGADDFIVKPFSPKELIARIQALLRRRNPEKTENIVVQGQLKLNPKTQCIQYGEQNINLPSNEFKVLHFLMTHRDILYSRRDLLNHIWGDHLFIEERTIDVYIKRVRQKLKPLGLSEYIHTARSKGYYFAPMS